MAHAITSIVVDMSTGTITINGSGFLIGSSIDVRDPYGRRISFTILSFSPTQIGLLAALTIDGQYCVTIADPNPIPGSVPAGSFMINGGD